MSIATSITGSSGASNQLLDLLAVVANPDIYKAKLDALEEATAANKVYVEAIGPASEIVALREQAALEKQQADEVLDKANASADKIVSDAQTQANTLVSSAQTQANAIAAQAQKLKAEAEQILLEANAAAAEAQRAQVKADSAQASADAQAAMLQTSQEAADQAVAEAKALKADIIAKHEAFIKGL
jgi:cell division septum initiation protein DivIVA